MKQKEKCNAYEVLIDQQLFQLKEFNQTIFNHLSEILVQQQQQIDKQIDKIGNIINKKLLNEDIYENQVLFQIQQCTHSIQSFYSKVKKDLESNKFELKEQIVFMTSQFIDIQLKDQDFIKSMKTRINQINKLNLWEFRQIQMKMDDKHLMYSQLMFNNIEEQLQKTQFSEIEQLIILKQASRLINIFHLNDLVHGNLTSKHIYYDSNCQLVYFDGHILEDSQFSTLFSDYYLYPKENMLKSFISSSITNRKTFFMGQDKIVDYFNFWKLYTFLSTNGQIQRMHQYETNNIENLLIKELFVNLQKVIHEQKSELIESIKKMYPFSKIYEEIDRMITKKQQTNLRKYQLSPLSEYDFEDKNEKCIIHNLKKKYEKDSYLMCKLCLLKYHNQQSLLNQITIQMQQQMQNTLEQKSKHQDINFHNFINQQWKRFNNKLSEDQNSFSSVQLLQFFIHFRNQQNQLIEIYVG